MIQAHEPMIFQMPGGDTSKQVAVSFEQGNKIVSLSLNNSCGRMSELRRGSIQCMIRDNDGIAIPCMTVFNMKSNDMVMDATIENLSTAMNWLRRLNWGFDGQGK
jgi:hypothetical protein